MAENRAVRVTIEWDDGMQHDFERQPGGHWDLALSEPEHGTLRVTGYDGPNLMRVLGAAAETTEVAS